LTVSGQLEAKLQQWDWEEFILLPTFRAENSNTTRHLAEFWMVEPEVAFNNLEDNIDLAENFLKYVIGYVLENCKDDLKF
jgi:asparaginyl-tRNA synthetase